jgi:hypothetical protein
MSGVGPAVGTGSGVPAGVGVFCAGTVVGSVTGAALGGVAAVALVGEVTAGAFVPLQAASTTISRTANRAIKRDLILLLWRLSKTWRGSTLKIAVATKPPQG